MTTTTDRAKTYLTDLYNNGVSATSEFATKLTNDQNPADVLRWADNFVRYSAEMEMAARLLALFERGADFETVMNYALRETLSRASQVPSSTSQMSNLVDAQRSAAYARFIEKFMEVL